MEKYITIKESDFQQLQQQAEQKEENQTIKVKVDRGYLIHELTDYNGRHDYIITFEAKEWIDEQFVGKIIDIYMKKYIDSNDAIRKDISAQIRDLKYETERLQRTKKIPGWVKRLIRFFIDKRKR